MNSEEKQKLKRNIEEAIEASLNAARTKLSRLETALGKADRPDFGLCANGNNPFPPSRILQI